MNTKMLAFALLTATAIIAGCGKQPASETSTAAAPAASEIPPPAPVVAEPVITQDSPIWFEPERVSDCSKGEVLTVHWNASSFPGVSVVEISVAGKDGAEALFASTGVINQKQTGPWALAGTEFVLRDQATKQELQRTRVPSTPCATP